MNIEDLKANWKLAGSEKKNQEELLQMMAVNKHPVVKKTKIRFTIESFWLIVFLLVFYDAFDGASKPMWASVFLIAATLAYIINRIIGWFLLKDPITADNLTTSLSRFQKNLKRIAISSIITALLLGISIIVFFSSAIKYTEIKYLMLFGMIATLLLFVYASYKIWSKRIQTIVQTIHDFSE